jgi:hypothetical protein
MTYELHTAPLDTTSLYVSEVNTMTYLSGRTIWVLDKAVLLGHLAIVSWVGKDQASDRSCLLCSYLVSH